MTTTIFRRTKTGKVFTASIASDSRVSLLIDNLVVQWFDDTNIEKNIRIDDNLFGFAGTNVLYKMFLERYYLVSDTDRLLDMIIEVAKSRKAQFFILKYNITLDELKLFAYSPPIDDGANDAPEIYRISKDPVITKSVYAIGSGKDSKAYKKNHGHKIPRYPISQIISANDLGLRKQNLLQLLEEVKVRHLTYDEAGNAYRACFGKGGDLFTGGEIIMSSSAMNATAKKVAEQVALLNAMDKSSKAQGAVCASPINASLEVRELHSMGQRAVSEHKIEWTEESLALFQDLAASFDSSMPKC